MYIQYTDRESHQLKGMIVDTDFNTFTLNFSEIKGIRVDRNYLIRFKVKFCKFSSRFQFYLAFIT